MADQDHADNEDMAIQHVIEIIWDQYDEDGNGSLDK